MIQTEVNNAGVIYCTTNLVDGKKYIGQDSKNNSNYLGSGIRLINAVKKYGRDNFEKEVLQYCIDKDDLNESEKYWIQYFEAVTSDLFYNIADGGKGMGDFSKTHLERLSESHKGIKQSSQTIEKRVSKLRGTKRPLELVERTRLSRIGVSHSEESKRQISINRTGKRLSRTNHNAKAIIQLDINGVELRRFDCISDAARFLNLKRGSNIGNCLRGLISSACGFQWKYQN